jgi:2-oxo-3-hexenedioate decarboxylase
LQGGLERQLQDRTAMLSAGSTHRGWKAGFNTAAAMEKLGTDGPLVGYLTDATLLESDAVVDVAGWGKAVLEPEVALQLGATIPAGSDPDVAAAAISSVAAAIELVDLGAVGDDAREILAANVFHRHYLLGEFRPPADRVALEAVRIDVTDGSGEAVAAGADPREAIGDLVEVVRGLASLLATCGEELGAGDVIITGSAISPLQVSGGEQVRVGVGSSTVAVRIA